MDRTWIVVGWIACVIVLVPACGGGPSTPAREVTRTTETEEATIEETVVEPASASEADGGVAPSKP